MIGFMVKEADAFTDDKTLLINCGIMPSAGCLANVRPGSCLKLTKYCFLLRDPHR